MGRAISAFNGPGLSPKQEAAAVALASGCSLQKTAARAGVGETTLKRWLAEQPALRQRVRELRALLTDRAVGKLAAAMTAAARTLRQLCLKSKSETVRLKAADSLLTHGSQLSALAELQAEVEELKSNLPGRRR
jgi:hypothetical protein